MIIFLPLKHCKDNLQSLEYKLSKSHIIKGIYPSYDKQNSFPVVLIRNMSGNWNLFINQKHNDQVIADILKFILKNKRGFLFIMSISTDNEIKLDKK